jgi:D-amino-acid oxidase
MNVIVLGSGVSGLSCGIRLLEVGYAVTLWARDLPPHTTSDVAAAIWYPYRAHPEDRVLAWSRRTFAVLEELARMSGTGVSMISGIALLRRPAPDLDGPWWRDAVRDFRHATSDEVPPGYAGGYVFTVPVAEMPIYLGRYLVPRFHALGGKTVRREVGSLAEVLAESPVVVNCTGLCARSLVGDTAMFPIRGQVVRISGSLGSRFVFDEERPNGMAYIIPRSTDCILGGTAEEHAWSLEPDLAVSAAIVDRCADLDHAIEGAVVLEHRVGLRPGRASVRVEVEPTPDGGLVVHNYGHGGAGVTLSWGCAEDVVRLIRQHHGGSSTA